MHLFRSVCLVFIVMAMNSDSVSRASKSNKYRSMIKRGTVSYPSPVTTTAPPDTAPTTTASPAMCPCPDSGSAPMDCTCPTNGVVFSVNQALVNLNPSLGQILFSVLGTSETIQQLVTLIETLLMQITGCPITMAEPTPTSPGFLGLPAALGVR